jgi:NAD(P)-dependent dehydrogenase (short-subunit alcohol dehydrogenase family)
MTNLSHSVVLITGADGGFGRQMRRQFLKAGSRLILSDIDDRRLSAMEDGPDRGSENIIATIAADLSGEGGCQALFHKVLEAGMVPDVIVNNAGVGLGGRFDSIPDRASQRTHRKYFLDCRLDRVKGTHFVLLSQIRFAGIRRSAGG